MTRPYRTYSRSDPLGLTKSERGICLLLASGMSKREVAAATGAPYQTICSHVKHVYRKLDVHRLPELRERLYAAGFDRPAAVQAPPAPTPLERALTAARELVAALEEMRSKGDEWSLDRHAFELDVRTLGTSFEETHTAIGEETDSAGLA